MGVVAGVAASVPADVFDLLALVFEGCEASVRSWKDGGRSGAVNFEVAGDTRSIETVLWTPLSSIVSVRDWKAMTRNGPRFFEHQFVSIGVWHLLCIG